MILICILILYSLREMRSTLPPAFVMAVVGFIILNQEFAFDAARDKEHLRTARFIEIRISRLVNESILKSAAGRQLRQACMGLWRCRQPNMASARRRKPIAPLGWSVGFFYCNSTAGVAAGTRGAREGPATRRRRFNLGHLCLTSGQQHAK